MSTKTYVLMEKLEKYQYFLFEKKKSLSRVMATVAQYGRKIPFLAVTIYLNILQEIQYRLIHENSDEQSRLHNYTVCPVSSKQMAF